MSNLFRWGEFNLHSRDTSPFKIDCDALTTADWECLANLIAQRSGPFSSVYGIPTGGLILAAHLLSHVTGNPDDPTLIVDDVYTTGRSMNEARDALDDPSNAIGFVVFARRRVNEEWINALFIMP